MVRFLDSISHTVEGVVVSILNVGFILAPAVSLAVVIYVGVWMVRKLMELRKL